MRFGRNMEEEKQVLKILKAAGWYEGRKIDVSEQLKLYEECGFEVFDILPRFLEEFDGIHFDDIRHFEENREADYYSNKEIVKRNCFDIRYILSWELIGLENSPESKRKIVNRYCGIKGHINEKYVPIGHTGQMEYSLYLTETGKIVSDIGVKGMSIEEAIKNIVLCCGKCPWEDFNQNFSKLTYEQVISQGEKSVREPKVGRYMQENIQTEQSEEVVLYDLYDSGTIKHYYHFIPKGKCTYCAWVRKVEFYESGKIKSYSYVRSNKDGVVVIEWYESGMIKSRTFYREKRIRSILYDENGVYLMDDVQEVADGISL